MNINSTSDLESVCSEKFHTFLKVYSKLLVGSVMLLILIGASVTSHDAGLSVPDWPTTYGENMFTFPYSKWIGGVFFEHSHRLVASGVGFLTLLLTVFTFAFQCNRVVKGFAMSALFLVIMQGILGGMTVLYGLPDAISVLHGVIGQTFFLLVLTIAYFFSNEFKYRRVFAKEHVFRGSMKLFVVFFASLYLQLILGAVMRHSGSGIAVLDFPKFGGNLLPSLSSDVFETVNNQRSLALLPPVTTLQILLHALHRYWAFFIVLILFITMYYNRSLLISRGTFSSHFKAVVGIVFLQVLLGIGALMMKREPWITSIHVLLGAMLLGLTYMLLLRIYESRKSYTRLNEV
jgi:heme a synthase